MQDLTQRGVTALKAGDRLEAYKLLSQAVKEQPEDAYAWLWLSGAVDDDEQRIACLRQVLRIAPENQAAARGLERLLAKSNPPAPPPSEPRPEPSPPAAELHEQDLSNQVEILETPPEEIMQAEETIPHENVSLRRQERSYEKSVETPAQKIFRTRPSMVPALTCFWLFLFCSALLANLIGNISQTALLTAVGIGVILEFVVLFVVVRNFRCTYELTDQSITMRIWGKKTSIPLSNILHVEPRRTSWQKIRGTADLMIDAVVSGELTHLRLRDIPDFQRRMDQIQDVSVNLE